MESRARARGATLAKIDAAERAPAIEAIAYTGRTKIGAAIASVAAPRFSVA